jgi:transcriptional regulator with XRE-family HTH domain
MLERIRRKKYPRRMVKRTISSATLTAVGARLRMLRNVIGHSQAEWARVLRIEPQILNKWERGTRQPNVETLILICGSTGCTLDFIFRGRVGADMRQELREALLSSYRESPFVFELVSPVAPSSPEPGPRKRGRPS